jgi:hypothetical protein
MPVVMLPMFSVHCAGFRISPSIGPAEVAGRQAHRPTAFLAIWHAGRQIEGTLAERYVREVRNIWAPLEDLRDLSRLSKRAREFVQFEPFARRDAQGGRDRRNPADIPRSNDWPIHRQAGARQAIGAAWTNGPPGKTIGICEGFEAAAAYTSLTGIQAWATMGAQALPPGRDPGQRRAAILLADNDPEGRRAEARARKASARPGLAIDTEWPPGRMNDWAQLLNW